MHTISRAIMIIVLFLPSGLWAQADRDVVYLKNGTQFEGKILEYQQEKSLRFRLRSGGILEFRKEEVSRVEEGLRYSETERQKAKQESSEKAYAFKEKGMFNVTYFSTLSGSADNNFKLGLGLHNVTGYQFHRLFGLGLGFGVDTYSFDDGETLYPIFAEIRGYLIPKKIAPYYSGSLGYGFAFKNSDEFIRKAEGGLLFRTALGLRLGADDDTNVLVDVGYQFQEAFFERRTPFQNEIEEKRLKFSRIVIRTGIIF